MTFSFVRAAILSLRLPVTRRKASATRGLGPIQGCAAGGTHLRSRDTEEFRVGHTPREGGDQSGSKRVTGRFTRRDRDAH